MEADNIAEAVAGRWLRQRNPLFQTGMCRPWHPLAGPDAQSHGRKPDASDWHNPRLLRRPILRQASMLSLRVLGIALASTLLGACATMAPRTAAGEARAFAVEVPAIKRPDGETPAWWFRAGAAQAAQRGAMGGRARDVILFVGDGMILTTVAAARILEGQRKGGAGEENRLGWED